MWGDIRRHPEWVLGGAVYAWTRNGPEGVDRNFGLTDDGVPVDGRSLDALAELFQAATDEPGHARRSARCWSAACWSSVQARAWLAQRTACGPKRAFTPAAIQARRTRRRGPTRASRTRRRPMRPSRSTLHVDLGGEAQSERRPILGAGFNFEHALWSCPEFRGLFRSEILDPFMPAIARVDSGLLPAAPAELPGGGARPGRLRIGSVIGAVRRQLALLPCAQPRRGQDRPRRVGRAGAVHRRRHAAGRAPAPALRRLRRLCRDTSSISSSRSSGSSCGRRPSPTSPTAATATRSRPTGWRISPTSWRRAWRPLGVKLYGPDTATARMRCAYLPDLLDDPVVADNLAFVGFHQYFAEPGGRRRRQISSMRDARTLPVIVTEYTSFGFGDLDDGQEANDQYGFTLDIAQHPAVASTARVSTRRCTGMPSTICSPATTRSRAGGCCRGRREISHAACATTGCCRSCRTCSPGRRCCRPPGGWLGLHTLELFARRTVIRPSSWSARTTDRST